MPRDLPIVTTSSRYALARCPQLWWWRFEEGLAPKSENADALWFGIGIHEALAKWYGKGLKRGPHPAETFSNWCGEEMREIRAVLAERESEWYDEPKYEDARELGIDMLCHYIETYDRDSDWDVLAVETPFRVRVKNAGVPVAIFSSTLDLVYRDLADGRIYLCDHKTASQVQTGYLELDPQAGSYWAVASSLGHSRGWLKPGEEIAGITYNILRKAKEDVRPQDESGRYLNQDGSVSKRQPPAPFLRHIVERQPSEIRSEMQAIADDAIFIESLRKGTQPIRKNRTKDCTFCDFFLLCKLDQQDSHGLGEYMDAGFVRTDPYERYRAKSASE